MRLMFQLTRPRGARRAGHIQAGAGEQVSTHAPAWGATATSSKIRLITAVSTHAPAWGATYSPAARVKRQKFQLTRPRGARHRPPPAGRGRIGFNSRARVGRDNSRPRRKASGGKFQLTRPRGARQASAAAAAAAAQFQLTRPRGARQSFLLTFLPTR